MSDETKAKAHEKLNTFYVKIGYPDKWRDYTGLTVNPKDSYYANIRRAAEFETLYSLKDEGKPVDKTKWYMSPQTVTQNTKTPRSRRIRYSPNFPIFQLRYKRKRR